jgi:hypothetical protein
MLIFNYGNKDCFSPRPFRIIEKWTKKMSKNENPKILLGKKIKLHRPERKMRQNVVMICIFYNYVSSNLTNVPLLFSSLKY